MDEKMEKWICFPWEFSVFNNSFHVNWWCVTRTRTISIYLLIKSYNLCPVTVLFSEDSVNSHADSMFPAPSAILEVSRDLFHFRCSTRHRPLNRCSTTAAVSLDFWRNEKKNIYCAVKHNNWIEINRRFDLFHSVDVTTLHIYGNYFRNFYLLSQEVLRSSPTFGAGLLFRSFVKR